MTENNNSTRTIIMFIIIMPIVGYLLLFAFKKNNESEAKANQCMQECAAQGYAGHDFKWNILSGPKCSCIGEQQPVTDVSVEK